MDLDKIKRGEPTDGLELISVKTGAKDLITISGSLLAGKRFSSTNVAVPELVARMLDHGTKRRSKAGLTQILERAGISISFSSDSSRIRFEMRLLKEHLALGVRLLSEMLIEPRFSAAELKIIKSIYVNELELQKEDTRAMAGRELRRKIFPKNHPNGTITIDEHIKLVQKTKVIDLERFHRNYFGLGSLKIAAAGDVSHKELNELLGKHFSKWVRRDTKLKRNNSAALTKKGEHLVHLADKANTDNFIGHVVKLDRDSREYLALHLGIFALGGDAIGRLFLSVREDKGLTYGVYTHLVGFEDGDDGYWFIYGIFAPSLLQKGKRAIKEVFDKWHKKGITAKELKIKKETLAGSFKVGLASSGGYAGALLSLLERGKDVDYFNSYLKTVKSLTLREVNKAVRDNIKPNSLYTVTAGTVSRKK